MLGGGRRIEPQEQPRPAALEEERRPRPERARMRLSEEPQRLPECICLPMTRGDEQLLVENRRLEKKTD